ncbi:MAG: glutathione S-transferase [Pseudomonadota bacterium]
MTTLYLGNLNYSSWSIRAVLVTRGAGLDVEEKVLPIGAEASYALLDTETGQHRVPALKTGDLVVHDSLAITEWAAEQAEPGKVWPRDPEKRARARSLCAEMHASFIDIRSFMGVDIRSRLALPTMTEGLKWDIQRILQIWEETRGTYASHGPYLFGEWSAADAFYMPVATRFRTYGYALGAAAAAYAEAVLSHPLSLQLIEEAKVEPWTLDPTKFKPKSAG